MRWVAVFALTVAGFGLLAGLGLWVSATAVLMFGIGVPAMLVLDKRFRPADEPPASPARPDADVAQYLNDGDRAWLMEHGDWTDPATRIVERPSSASDTLAADRKRRAEKVVSQMDSTDGWRTTRYADGRTVEHAVTDETWTSTPGNVLVVCPAGRYSDAGGTCAWTATVPEPAARRTRAAHLQASPFCGKSLAGRTHTPDGDPWPVGRSTEVTRRGAYASDAPVDDYERLARQMRGQAYIAHDVLGVERPT